MNEFNPSKDYDSLLRQAKALFRLYKSIEAERSYYQKKIREFEPANVIRLQAELESQRQMNHELTKELQNKP